MSTFTFRIDQRGREVLLNAVKMVRDAAAEPIVAGDNSQELLQQHEELLQLHRGLLYTSPDEEVVEEPVVGPEAGVNGGHGVDAPTE